jgi:hypothetical protein
LKWIRIASALVLCAAIFYAVALATRDCSVTPYFAVNCLGQWVEHHLGLPSSRLIRAFILEIVGIFLVAGLYLTIRYVFPHRHPEPSPEAPAAAPPDTHDYPEDVPLVNAEILVLRGIIEDPPNGSLRIAARSLLIRYHWVEPIHQEVFQALLRLPGNTPATLRNQLPAILTRRGFPDFDLNAFFEPAKLSKSEVMRLMEFLTSKS